MKPFQKAATFRSGQRSHFIVNEPGANKSPPGPSSVQAFAHQDVAVLKHGELH